ncbi:MAG: sodium:solute symporter [Leptolyngbya sp. PLA3]|nr:MAG: sodium:solute symporter [Cyanobacteria bacterium CYA]MCE7969902.1 sodium:solute symporter [Leptolyngbya sp. PL-A3]
MGDGRLLALDWIVLLGYFVLLVASGLWFGRRKQHDTEDYFLAGRRMPAWAVSVSIVATSMSAASFIGVPQSSYNGNLTYLATNIGMVIAAGVIARVFIPAFYRQRVQTIYELLGIRFGPSASTSASVAFMLGRIMASGARIYIGAIPASIVVFGDLEPGHLVLAIALLSFIGIVYTLVGGVGSVIWTDVIQMGVFIGACIVAIVLIAGHIQAPWSEVAAALREGSGQTSKLTLIDSGLRETGFDWVSAFTLPACIIGFTIMGIGSYGVDHDLVQRMLTCRDANRGGTSVIGGILLGVPSVALFLIVGLLLWVFYQRPELTDSNAVAPEDTRRVFLEFIIEEMPAGVSGLMLSGLFAAGLSSVNSTINAMSATFVNDVYRKIVRGRHEKHYLRTGRICVVGWGIVLGAFACVCVFWQQHIGHINESSDLLDFALSVMTFAYAGLVAVFLTALLTRRGSARSAIAALVVGFVAVLLMDRIFWDRFVDLAAMERTAAQTGEKPLLLALVSLAFVWKLTLATGVAMVVCVAGKTRKDAA